MVLVYDVEVAAQLGVDDACTSSDHLWTGGCGAEGIKGPTRKEVDVELDWTSHLGILGRNDNTKSLSLKFLWLWIAQKVFSILASVVFTHEENDKG